MRLPLGSQRDPVSPRWTPDLHAGRALRRYVILIGVVAVVVVIGIPAIARGGSAVPQPIAFNHLKHTGDLGLACDFCHEYVRTGQHSGLPNETKCAMCHSARQGTSDEAAKVTELIEEGSLIRFRKLFQLPDHVFYTHRRHVTIAELECESCHGDIATTETPPDRALVKIDMDFCMDCHREQEATLDCNACHR